MSERLMTVISLIGSPAVRVIDVGSDHGKLAAWCLLEDIAETAVCTDIHKDPAERTRQCLDDYLLSGRSEVYCTDGLSGVELRKGDVVVMAGLGGNNMIDIMEAAAASAPEAVMKEILWVLQPQKSIERVRKYLAQKGYVIKDEKTCIDRDIFYQMMCCSYTGVPYELTLKEIYYGPVFMKKAAEGDELVKAFHRHMDDIYKIRARGDSEIARMLGS